MAEKDFSKFKISNDDERPDLQLEEEFDDSKIDRLNRRISRASFLTFCLIAVIIFAAYFYIKNNIYTMNDTGAMGVQMLSKELESRFSSLSIREANLEESLGKRVDSLTKTTASLQKNIEQAITAIKQNKSARKADNKNTALAINKINKTLASTPKDLDKILSDLHILNDTLTQRITDLSQNFKNVKNDLLKIQADISSLKSIKVDKKYFDEALKDQQKVYQLALRQLTTHLEERIKHLEKKLKELEKTNPLPNQPKQTPSKKSVSSSNTEVEKTPSSVSPEKTVPKPGTIIEQDLEHQTPG